jgi:hypothetical protein
MGLWLVSTLASQEYGDLLTGLKARYKALSYVCTVWWGFEIYHLCESAWDEHDTKSGAGETAIWYCRRGQYVG